MKDNKIKILKSFQDTDFSSLKMRRGFEINSLNYLIGNGYINLDTPIIESADLFFRKSWAVLQETHIHSQILKINKSV